MLAYLLLHAGTVVSADRMIGAVWGNAPPGTARAQVHAGVTAIRRVLRQADAAELMESRSGGYVISPGPGQSDLAEFGGHVAAAQELARGGDEPAAAQRLRLAVALWRGEPLAGVTAAYAPEARERLEGRRLAAFERLAELELLLGRHDDLIDELASQMAAHPLRERLCEQLMLALHRAGRQTEALGAARKFRTALAEQQGLDPSRTFAALEQAILRDDPRLDHRTAATAGAWQAGVAVTGSRRPVKFLPYDTPDFSGRATELDRLAQPGPATGATIWLIDGMAGVGKTALAVHAAHRLAGRFPDGHLFADLEACTPGRQPAEPGAVLELLLRHLGVPAERIPDTIADRAALWRAELSDREIVAVLDNAAGVGQVRPLLPGASRSLILITSRNRITGIDGAQVLSLDLLEAEDSVGLFTRIVGDRAHAEPTAVLDVLHLCGFLPLAIRIAAARLQHRPHWTVSHLAGRLRSQRHRLAELTAEDRGVAAAFTVSYQHLDPGQQRMFRLLGLHPGRDFDTQAAAALAGIAAGQADALLEGLLDAHLLAQAKPGRYTFHDLLREHAHATATEQDTAPTRQDALTRLLDYYLRAASAAITLLYPYTTRSQTCPAEAGDPAVPFDDTAQAARWLESERANLIACGVHAAGHNRPDHASQLATTLFPYLYDYGHHAAALTLHGEARRASRQHGDTAGEGRALAGQAWTYWRLGRYAEADELSREALRICEQSGDIFGLATALNALGGLRLRQRDFTEAHRHLHGALDLYQEIGDRVGISRALDNLGTCYAWQGRYELAREHFRRALDQLRQIGCGACCLEEAITRAHLGGVCLEQGRYEEALDHHQRALAVFRELGNRSEEAVVRNGLGETALAMGDRDRAVADHDAALTLAREAGNTFEQAHAHGGLARAHRDLGHLGQAREHASQARDLYLSLGVPDAADASAFLASFR
jgi:DNA-binding SARP family transcriptional activator/tetratricopeptide (TPR) repeat protein